MTVSHVQGAVTLIFKTGNEDLDVFKQPLPSTCTLIAKGTYRSIMALWTGINKKYFYPDLSVLDTVPSVQGFFDSATYYLGLNPNFPYIKKIYMPESFLSAETMTVPYTNYTIRKPQWPFSVYYASTSPKINNKFLEKYRLEEGFSGGARAYEIAFNLCKTIFSETDIGRNDFLLTSDSSLTTEAHKLITRALRSERLDGIIEKEGKKLIDRWNRSADLDEPIDLSAEMRYFSSSIITQAICENSDNYKELSDAVHFMNCYIVNEILGIVKPGDKEEFEMSCATFKGITNNILNCNGLSNLPLFKDSKLTYPQNQALCFFLYFAGQETTAFALAHEFAQLILNPIQMSVIRNAIEKSRDSNINPREIPELKEFINETLLKIPPVDGVSRKISSDVYLSFTDSEGKRFGQLIPSHERVFANISGTAKMLLQDAEKPSYQDASIFGGGKHQCIGRNTALKEMTQLPIMIFSAFEITTKEIEFKHRSQATEQAKPFLIRVKRTIG